LLKETVAAFEGVYVKDSFEVSIHSLQDWHTNHCTAPFENMISDLIKKETNTYSRKPVIYYSNLALYFSWRKTLQKTHH